MVQHRQRTIREPQPATRAPIKKNNKQGNSANRPKAAAQDDSKKPTEAAAPKKTEKPSFDKSKKSGKPKANVKLNAMVQDHPFSDDSADSGGESD
jgi:hypothetical protein